MSCCRACMHSDFSTTDKLYSLTGEWMSIYSFCTSIELSEHDCLPKTLCQTCYDLLSKFYSFKNQCLKSNTALLEKYASGVEEEKFSGILSSDIKKEDDSDHYFDDIPDDGMDIKQESEESEDSDWRPRVKVTNKKTYKKIGQKFCCPMKRCKRKYRLEGSLEAHLLMRHKGRTIEFECDKCKGKRFQSFSLLHSHDKAVHQLKESKCETCGKICKSQTALQFHLSYHKNIGAFVCQTCGRAMNCRESLQEHEETHQENRSRDHKCDRCGNSFFSRRHLLKHIARIHNVKRNHPCNVCLKTFSLAGLKKHAIVHMTVKPFLCKHCDNRYSSAWFLREHMRKHTGENPFACVHCSMSFASKQLLIRHLERAHTNEKITSATLPAHMPSPS